MADNRPQINVRLDDAALLQAIDDRAARFGLTRNAWLNRALRRLVDMPTATRTVTITEKS